MFQQHMVIIRLANKNENKYTLEVIHYMYNLMMQRFLGFQLLRNLELIYDIYIRG